jgi:hypothetical protein
MVVTPEMRREWASKGMSAVATIERHAIEADTKRSGIGGE